MLVNPKK